MQTTWVVKWQCIADEEREAERGREQTKQFHGARCPLMISSREWKHCCRVQIQCYGFTLASLPWSVDLTDVTGQAVSVAWGKLALLLLRTSELSPSPPPFVNQTEVGRQTDRDRKGDQTTRAETHCMQSLVNHNDVQWPTSSRRLGIKTSRLYSHLLVINSARAIVLEAGRQDFSLQQHRIPVTT